MNISLNRDLFKSYVKGKENHSEMIASINDLKEVELKEIARAFYIKRDKIKEVNLIIHVIEYNKSFITYFVVNPIDGEDELGEIQVLEKKYDFFKECNVKDCEKAVKDWLDYIVKSNRIGVIE